MAKLLEQLPGGPARPLYNAQEHMLHADILVLHLPGLGLGGVQRPVQIAGDIDLFRVPAAAGHPRQGGNFLGGGIGKGVGVNAHGLQKLGDQAVLLLGKGRQQVLLLDGLVGIFHGKALRVLQGLDGFLGKLVHVHIADLLCVDTM